jgi:hypothetical protein
MRTQAAAAELGWAGAARCARGVVRQPHPAGRAAEDNALNKCPQRAGRAARGGGLVVDLQPQGLNWPFLSRIKNSTSNDYRDYFHFFPHPILFLLSYGLIPGSIDRSSLLLFIAPRLSPSLLLCDLEFSLSLSLSLSLWESLFRILHFLLLSSTFASPYSCYYEWGV